MPTAAVTLDPIDYIKVVVVKKIKVGLMVGAIGATLHVGNFVVSCNTWEDPVWY